MFLTLTHIHTHRYHIIISSGSCIFICEDFLCIPDVFHMNYLIESYNNMPLYQRIPKKKNFFKSWLERQEAYWKLRRWIWRRQKSVK